MSFANHINLAGLALNFILWLVVSTRQPDNPAAYFFGFAMFCFGFAFIVRRSLEKLEKKENDSKN